ncbi:MAG: single-stranded-DNA-specific exonuclease RecJ [Pseudomonadota bacterium]
MTLQATESECLLGVERSCTGKRWLLRACDERQSLALSQRLGLPDTIGRILSSRGIDIDQAESFLSPTLKELIPDPLCLKDMDKAVDVLASAIQQQRPIAVFGDYDVDGATSSSLLKLFLQSLGVPLEVYIPDRIREGYGPNSAAMHALASKGIELVVTVDCGITAYDALQAAADQGLGVIVVDHHVAETRLPPAQAVVNPNRLDDESGLGHLAAVGVTFLLLVALNRALRDRGWYAAQGVQEPSLMQLLDLVALGTVCDVVPLTGLNRAFVTQGLKVLAQRRNQGLQALSDVARVDEMPSAYHLGFILGPRVNAGGRVGEAGLGTELLTSADTGTARTLAQRLDDYNNERREIEASVLEQAIQEVEGQDGPRDLVIAVGENWHPGVIGIVASRLKERFDRPSIVISLDEEGVGKGSGRSVPGVDLGSVVLAARQKGLLINGGGHAMAAGLTVARDQLSALQEFMSERVSQVLSGLAYQPTLRLDGILQYQAGHYAFYQSLEQLAPFGTGNPEPRFAVPNVQILRADVVGSDHLRVFARTETGERLKGIAFRSVGRPLGDLLQAAKDFPVHLAGKLRRDSWAGPEALQLHIEDAARITP